MAARGTPISLTLPRREAKAMSLWEALSWIKSLCLSQVEVEIDAKVLFDALNVRPSALSPFEMLIAGCLMSVSTMEILYSF